MADEKKQLMIAKQHLDKLSVFIVNMVNFYAGAQPSVDDDLSSMKKFLSGKPDYDSASELSAKLNDDLKKESKLFQQQNTSAINQLTSSLRNLNKLEGLTSDTRKEVTNFSNSLAAIKKLSVSPMSKFEEALNIYDKALGEYEKTKAKSGAEKPLASPQVTADLLDLLEPVQAARKTDINIKQLVGKIRRDKTMEDQIANCVETLRVMVRNLVKDAGATSKMVMELHKAMVKIQESLQISISDIEINDDARKEQDEGLHEQLKHINTAVKTSNDIDELKQKVKVGLSKMNKLLKEGRDRDTNLQMKMFGLNTQLQRMIDQAEADAFNHKKEVFNLRSMTLTDVLTQLPNRLSYEEKMKYEYTEMEKNKTPFCIAMFCVDELEKIRKKFDDDIADKCIQIIANSVRKYLPAHDFVCRWGGEDFIVLFPDTTKNSAYVRLEAVRKKISTLPFMYKGEKISMTISVGVTQVKDSPDSSFKEAERHLYLAKQRGRNITVYEDEE